MPSLLLHAAAVDRLAAEPGEMPARMAHALSEDVEYARLGALLSDLPMFDGIRGGIAPFLPLREPPHFARLFHAKAPVAFGLKIAELVAIGALVGKEPGRAFLAGYFTHVCLDRTLHPLLERLAGHLREPGESMWRAHARIEWIQGLLYMRDVFGEEMLGKPRLKAHLQVTKRPGLPTRGIGRGLYELVRVASHETFQEAPSKAEVDSWVRGLYLQSVVLSSPLGRLRGLKPPSALVEYEVYRGIGVDVAATVEDGLRVTRHVLGHLEAHMAHGRFTERARKRFFAEVPEGSIEACAA